MSKTHKCAICSKNGATGATSVLVWLGLVPEGKKGYAHPACIKKARADRLAKMGKKVPAPREKAAPKAEEAPVPAPEPVTLYTPPLRPIPKALNGWKLRRDELGLIHASKKGEDELIFPNVTRMNDGLREA